MAIRDILIIPEKKLRLISEPIKAFDKPLRTLVDDMFEIGRASCRERV